MYTILVGTWTKGDCSVITIPATGSRQLAKVLLAWPFANMAVLSVGNNGNFKRFSTNHRTLLLHPNFTIRPSTGICVTRWAKTRHFCTFLKFLFIASVFCIINKEWTAKVFQPLVIHKLGVTALEIWNSKNLYCTEIIRKINYRRLYNGLYLWTETNYEDGT